MLNHDTTTPLVILIPPFSQPSSNSITPVPPCFQDYPTAVINYRWQPSEGDEPPEIPLHWPTPLHDISFGYSWLMDNLGSGTDNSADPRPAYVYGSYLGASLAAGLALTESHVPDRSLPMTIRGLIAHNGIYNWTMFLPDHPIHNLESQVKSKRRKGARRSPFASADATPSIPVEEEGIFTSFKHLAPGLFASPSELFDPFASACLFFHSANLHVPGDFTTPLSAYSSALSTEFTAAVDALANKSPLSPAITTTDQSRDATPTTTTAPSERVEEEGQDESADSLLAKATILAKQLRPPRKGYLVFPTRQSTLRLPHSLFLYDRPRDYYSASATTGTTNSTTGTTAINSGGSGGGRSRRGINNGHGHSRNNFRHQANELASLMMRSLDMHELRRREPSPWEWEGERELVDEAEDDARMSAIRERVQTFEVSPSSSLPVPPTGSLRGNGSLGWGGLGREEEEVVGEWLRERIDEDLGS